MKKAGLSSFLIAVVLLALGVIAEAQQPKKVHRIGYLSSSDPASDSPRFEAIRLALRDLGYIEGQNIASEYRYAEGKLDRLPDLAAELVRLKIDIIVVGGDIPTRAAKKATKKRAAGAKKTVKKRATGAKKATKKRATSRAGRR